MAKLKSVKDAIADLERNGGLKVYTLEPGMTVTLSPWAMAVVQEAVEAFKDRLDPASAQALLHNLSHAESIQLKLRGRT